MRAYVDSFAAFFVLKIIDAFNDMHISDFVLSLVCVPVPDKTHKASKVSFSLYFPFMHSLMAHKSRFIYIFLVRMHRFELGKEVHWQRL